jgi:hypothetical protein
MTGHIQRKWLLALSAVSCVLVARAGLAAADEEKAPDKGAKPEHAEAEAGGEHEEEAEEGSEEGGKEGEGHKEHRKHEEVGMLDLDLVLGWGKVPFVVPNGQTNPAAPQVLTFSRSDQTPSNVQSFIFGGGLEVAPHVGVGLRVPLTFATFNPDGAASRSAAGLGNVELEGEYGGSVAKGLRLVGTLGLALPVAQGNEIPDVLVNAPNGSFDQAAYDRFSMAKAAAYARGYEDNALFEPNRFGIIPKVGLLWRLHGLSVEPYLKVENLVGTSSSLANGYVGELVGALRVGYWIRKEFELAVRGWFNTGFAGGDEDKVTSAAVEPQIVLRFGPVRPYAGVLLPVAGPPNDNGFIGVRIGVAAGF